MSLSICYAQMILRTCKAFLGLISRHFKHRTLKTEDVSALTIFLCHLILFLPLRAGALTSLQHLRIGILKTEDEVSMLALVLPSIAPTLTNLSVAMSFDAVDRGLSISSLTCLRVCFLSEYYRTRSYIVSLQFYASRFWPLHCIPHLLAGASPRHHSSMWLHHPTNIRKMILLVLTMLVSQTTQNAAR